MSEIGSPERPLRVAVIGAGPSGFYAAEALHARGPECVQVDMYDRLPTPFGLVRGGVAPDHQKIKSVTRVYDRIAAHPEFRFYGNVEFGRDVTHADLEAYYHAIIYAVGARTDRRMGIPGEHLPGSHSATEFVGWYNAHPDHRSLGFRLAEARRAVVVGNGNVAMDLARILASPRELLARTDIAPYALEALGGSGIEEIIVLGRRGPAQAAFTTKELRELGEIPGVGVWADPAEVALDPLSRAEVARSADRTRDANLEVLAGYAARPPAEGGRRIVLRFLASPVAILGENRVEGLEIERNELYRAEDGTLRPRATPQRETLRVDLVFRAIGYQGVALPGVPFDAWAGRIPNAGGRVLDPARGEVVRGEYAVGWIKRGPQGIIGTNKPDSHETVEALLADLAAGRLERAVPPRSVLEMLLHERKRDHVSYADWQLIDALERERGEETGAPRRKFAGVEEMLHALGERKEALAREAARAEAAQAEAAAGESRIS